MENLHGQIRGFSCWLSDLLTVRPRRIVLLSEPGFLTCKIKLRTTGGRWPTDQGSVEWDTTRVRRARVSMGSLRITVNLAKVSQVTVSCSGSGT